MKPTLPDYERTSMWDVIQFTRAVAALNGDTDHPIQDHLNTLEHFLFRLELLYERPDCKGED